MSNDFYNPTGNPAALTRGASSLIRAEYTLVSNGFDKVPSAAQQWGLTANYAADAGTANVYAITVAATYLTSYGIGMEVKFKAANSNTGASTLNVNALGNKALVQPDGATPLAAGHILAGQMVRAIYDGTSFQLANSGGTSFSSDPTQIQKQTYVKGTTGGTSTAYTLTPSPALAAYVADASFFVTFHTACGAAPTITISGLGTPPSLVKQLPDGTFANLAANDVPANHRSRVTLLSAAQAWVETLPVPRLPRAYAEYATSADLTTQIPADDTIPQNTEGTEIISVSYTPKTTTNRLRFRFQGTGTCVAGPANMIAALFSSASTNALAATAVVASVANTYQSLVLEHEYVPGTTSALTFSIRVGPGNATTMRMNGTSTGRLLGGVQKTTLVIDEFAS